MSQQNYQSVPNHLFLPPNHSHQPLSLDNSNYPLMSNPTTPPHLPISHDILSSLNPQYLSTSQLSPFGIPLLNIMSPFSKQLFPANGSQLFTMNPQCQLPPGWMQLPQKPSPTTPPASHKLPPKSPNRVKSSRSSSMHSYIQNQHEQSTMEAREIREIASATCLKAQDDFNMSACTDDIAIALTLCCSATTRLSSVIDDPPPEWDDQIMHQLKNTRKRYAERWRGLYRMFILKKISAQPPSPIPDDAGKKTKVQLNQYIQVSTDVVQKTPKKSPNKPLKSILKKPARRNSDGVENRSSLSVGNLSLSSSSCSIEALSTSSSSHSLAVSFPPLLRETGTQTSPVSLKQIPSDEHNFNNNNFPSVSPHKHYMLPTDDPIPIRRSSTMTNTSSSTSSLFKSLQLSIQSNTESLISNNYLIPPQEVRNKENLPPPSHKSATFQRSKPQPPLPNVSKNLPMKRSTCFTPPPPRRFSPEDGHRFTNSSKKWTNLCTEV